MYPCVCVCEQVLDISRNKFTRFPIELSTLPSLRDFNMANNHIKLLPRNINAMSFLDSLNLERYHMQ